MYDRSVDDATWAIKCRQMRGNYLMFSEEAPYIQMVAVGDGKDHPDCVAMDLVVAHGMSKWAAEHWPPHRPGCRCLTRTLSARQLELGKLTVTYEYDGE